MSAFTFQQKANKQKKIAFALSLLLLMLTFTCHNCCPKKENITSALSLFKSTFQNCPKRKRLPWHFHFSAQKKEITLAFGSRCSSPASRPPVADKPPVNLNPPGGNQPNTENIIKSHCQALQCPQKVSLSNQRCQKCPFSIAKNGTSGTDTKKRRPPWEGKVLEQKRKQF